VHVGAASNKCPEQVILQDTPRTAGIYREEKEAEEGKGEDTGNESDKEAGDIDSDGDDKQSNIN
jgi:hypothetical protein